MQGYDGVFIDEVHYAKDWAIHLKALYDSFATKKIAACDSSTIVLRSGIADLSRRYVPRFIPLMSFREYSMLELDIELPFINPVSYEDKIINELFGKYNVLKLFNEYLRYGFRPFYLESKQSYSDKMLATAAKILESDIPFIVPQLSEVHLRLMNSVIGYLAISNIPTLQLNSLCTQWSIGKEKLYQLLYAMERAHLIRIIRKENDTKVNSIGSKIFLYDPSMYHLFGGNTGNIREAYAVAAFSEAGRKVFASKNESEYDFIVDSVKVEIGGRKKIQKEADFVIRDNIDLPYDKVIPLWMLGFAN
jgi:predicted AAA+ superfamily ATPase